jgi:cleavage and polyadenylation specificity factor subunit 1
MHYKAISSELKQESHKQEDIESIGTKAQCNTHSILHINIFFTDSMLDQEEEQIYFKSTSTLKKLENPVALVKYEFQVMDSLVNVGPIVDMTRTDSWDPVSTSHNNFPEFLNRKDKTEKELRTCSGYAKNGSICVLQQSLRPELLFALEISGIMGMWSLYCSDSDSQFHNLMIVSRESSTMVTFTKLLIFFRFYNWEKV